MVMERGPDGRFVKGKPGGPGRPSRETEAEYRLAFTTAVPLAEWRLILAMALLQAKQGDDKARRFLADYIVGRPEETVWAHVTRSTSIEEITDDELARIAAGRSGGTAET